ncbi:hypothetical protein [Streptomyces griseosporeus]|uniref:SCO2583/SCO2584 N-terminal domain-containing protein n=1 Tax=Streptomyces griseosporeus TaxID=1910 RepID=UPI0036FAD25A
MPEQDEFEREFDLRWADSAEHKEPSARARMLAARWKDNPPEPVPFRPEPGRGRARRAGWWKTALILGCVAAAVGWLVWARVRASY